MKKDRLTIFLSHSHKDEEKIRKIRDVLEILDCEPLIFFLKCLDDHNSELEDFIKKEIEARNIFIYCKSENAEKSEWVQKELEYIRSIDKSRLYEIDIEKDFKSGMINLITSLANILKSNRVFISCSAKDRYVQTKISDYLQERGMQVFDLKKQLLGNFYEMIENEIRAVAKEGVFVMLYSDNALNSKCVDLEYDKALEYGAKIIPIVVKGTDLPFKLSKNNFILIDKEPTEKQLENVYRAISAQ